MATKRGSDGKSASGKTSGRAAAGRYDGLRQRASDDATVWSLVSPESLRRCISLVTACGDAITLSVTRDGGAACLALLTDNEVIKVYASTVEELDEYLGAISDGAQAAWLSANS